MAFFCVIPLIEYIIPSLPVTMTKYIQEGNYSIYMRCVIKINASMKYNVIKLLCYGQVIIQHLLL